MHMTLLNTYKVGVDDKILKIEHLIGGSKNIQKSSHEFYRKLVSIVRSLLTLK